MVVSASAGRALASASARLTTRSRVTGRLVLSNCSCTAPDVLTLARLCEREVAGAARGRIAPRVRTQPALTVSTSGLLTWSELKDLACEPTNKYRRLTVVSAGWV